MCLIVSGRGRARVWTGMMVRVRMEVRNRLTMLRAPVALRKAQVTPGRAGWVVIYPLASDQGYNVRSFEVDAALLKDEDSIWDEVMEHLSDRRVDTIEEAEAHVAALGEDPECLDAPWKVDCPV